MKKGLFITILIIGTSLNSMAQKSKGYEKSIEIGASLGVGDYKNNTYSIAMINGYRFNDYLFAGVGVGFGYTNAVSYVTSNRFMDLYLEQINRFEQLPVPIFFDAKVNFLGKNKFSPFIRVDIGYTIDAKQYLRDAPGLMIEPSLGMDFFLSDKLSIYTLLGFNLQKQEIDVYRDLGNPYYGNIIKDRDMLKAISLRIGLIF